MSVRETLQIGHPTLKASNSSIVNFSDPALYQLIEDLKETMQENGLIGMAAPQIGENFQVFVTQPRSTASRKTSTEDSFRVYINPVIVDASAEENIIYEGCGSVLHGKLFGPVRRPQKITVEAFDIDEKRFRLTCDGILARVIQHEYDHLQGVEFLEKVSDYKDLMTDEFYRERVRASELQVRASEITVLELTYP